MDKQKKAFSNEIDGIIIGCALGQGCDEAELVRLAIEYATMFRCPYQLSAAHMRSLETDMERGTALRLEANMNNVIRHTIRRTTPSMAGLSRLAMQRFTDQPKPIPRELVRTCKCSATRRSPFCGMPSHLCKYTPLHKMVPRRTKSFESSSRASSPSKTRKSRGGRRGRTRTK